MGIWEKISNSASDEDELSFKECVIDGHNEANRGKKAMMTCQRVKGTDKMVSYIGEDFATEYGNATRKKYGNLQKKGEWKLVSKVMAESRDGTRNLIQ
ncbi:hypothetical protein U1Q18_037434 [Sarracenia purpurea var. burkii]